MKAALESFFSSKKEDQVVFTIDHHKGSEEHQLNEEYFDSEIFDYSLNAVNTFPLFIKNIRAFDLEDTVIPIVSSSASVAKGWNKNLGMVFIDGSHSLESATLDYESWESHIKNGGALVIHDIFEDPELGGQAPYEIYKRALGEGYKLPQIVPKFIIGHSDMAPGRKSDPGMNFPWKRFSEKGLSIWPKNILNVQVDWDIFKYNAERFGYRAPTDNTDGWTKVLDVFRLRFQQPLPKALLLHI